MNNTNIYQQLQKHYQKLTAVLAKAKQRGRSQSFQEQLLGRLQRCSMQMKQLGAGVAVVAALGVATPVAGQAPLPFVEISPVPFSPSTFPRDASDYVNFVDLDGDNDLDVVMGSTGSLEYYENTGSSSNLTYVLRTGTNSPFPAFTNDETYASFVDFDGDGDLDMFVAPHTTLYAYTVNIDYYENVGGATSPSFQKAATSPLVDAETYVNSILPKGNTTIYAIPSFVDIDGDGDQDCFIALSSYDIKDDVNWPISQNEDRILYYENQGPTSNFNLVKQTAANNPLNSLATGMSTNEVVVKRLLFVEGSSTRDRDLDVLAGTSEAVHYYENTGTSTSPTFNKASYNMLDTAYSVIGLIGASSTIDFLKSIVLKGVHDIDKDGKLEVLFCDYQNGQSVHYLKDSATYTNLQQVAAAQPIQVYPNPTTGVLQLEQPLTGTAFIYSTVGQELYSKELEAAQDLDISVLPTGTYLLLIRTKEESYQQTVIIQD